MLLPCLFACVFNKQCCSIKFNSYFILFNEIVVYLVDNLCNIRLQKSNLILIELKGLKALSKSHYLRLQKLNYLSFYRERKKKRKKERKKKKRKEKGKKRKKGPFLLNLLKSCPMFVNLSNV